MRKLNKLLKNNPEIDRLPEGGVRICCNIVNSLLINYISAVFLKFLFIQNINIELRIQAIRCYLSEDCTKKA